MSKFSNNQFNYYKQQGLRVPNKHVPTAELELAKGGAKSEITFGTVTPVLPVLPHLIGLFRPARIWLRPPDMAPE